MPCEFLCCVSLGTGGVCVCDSQPSVWRFVVVSSECNLSVPVFVCLLCFWVPTLTSLGSSLSSSATVLVTCRALYPRGRVKLGDGKATMATGMAKSAMTSMTMSVCCSYVAVPRAVRISDFCCFLCVCVVSSFRVLSSLSSSCGSLPQSSSLTITFREPFSKLCFGV